MAGGAGFIGSHLCERLLERGDEVVAVDNFLTGARSNLVTMLGADGCSFVEHDVCEPLAVDGAVDAVLHLASPASPKDFATLPLEIMAVGSDGTRNLLELARAKGARFLVTSTSEVYGEPLEHPQVESYRGNVSTTGPAVATTRPALQRSVDDGVPPHRRRGRGHRPGVQHLRAPPEAGRRPGRVELPRPGDVRGAHHRVRRRPADPQLLLRGRRGRRVLALLDSTLTRPVNIGNPNEFTVGELAELVVELTARSRASCTSRCRSTIPRRRPDITLARESWAGSPEPICGPGLRTADWLRTVL